MYHTNEILELASNLEGFRDQELSSLGETGKLTCAIYSALSDMDSLDIFCMAAGGIPAKTRILAEHKFSKKRYYVRLKRLIAAGLVQKLGKHYVHTSLGQMIYETQTNYIRYLQSPPEVIRVRDFLPRSAVGPISEAH